MSQYVAYDGSDAGGKAPFSFDRERNAASDGALTAACEAARAAIRAFDAGAARGESFQRLCELSELEHCAVKAVSRTKCFTPTELAEKAFLLDCVARAGNRSAVTQEALDVAISLAADALALAKAMAGAGAPRA
jgi:hypothetical protein